MGVDPTRNNSEVNSRHEPQGTSSDQIRRILHTILSHWWLSDIWIGLGIFLEHFFIIQPCLGARCSSAGKSVRSWCDGSSDQSFMVDPLSYFSFQPVLHNWCNKGCGMYYPVCGVVHIKEPLLLIGKSSPCRGSGFPLSLSE